MRIMRKESQWGGEEGQTAAERKKEGKNRIMETAIAAHRRKTPSWKQKREEPRNHSILKRFPAGS